MPIESGFPRPDWVAIAELIEVEPESEWDRLWTDRARSWVKATAECLKGSYRVSETENFIVLSAENDRYTELLSSFLEGARRKILMTLDGIASDSGFGKHVALVFDAQEPYYEYISHFYPDRGEFVLNSGIFINSAYGHFAFPFLEMFEAEATSAHELTHAFLSHLPMSTEL